MKERRGGLKKKREKWEENKGERRKKIGEKGMRKKKRFFEKDLNSDAHGCT